MGGVSYCQRCLKGWKDIGMEVYCPDCHPRWEFWFGGICRLSFLNFCLSLLYGPLLLVWWGRWWPAALVVLAPVLVLVVLGLLRRRIDRLIDAGWLPENDPRHPHSNASHLQQGS